MSIRELLRQALLGTFSHRTLAILRWDIHFMAVRAGNFFGARQRHLDRRVREASRPLFLNLGSGPRGIDSKHWINVDGFADRNVHHVLDFTRGLPFADNTFDGIFCEHVMEHFDLETGSGVFRECLRILKPGGVMRTIVPNGAIILRAYFDDPAKIVARRQATSGAAMEAVNSFFRQRYEHQCIYDFDLMRHTLAAQGFDPVRNESFRKGHGPNELVLDDAKYEWESLYCEAVKPLVPTSVK